MVLWFQCEMSAVGNTLAHTHKHTTLCKCNGLQPNDDNTKSSSSFIIWNCLLMSQFPCREENMYSFWYLHGQPLYFIV